MSTAKHTPGPWSVFSIYAETEIRGPQESGAMIARMVPWGDSADTPDPQRANARLIAAAPELLEALRNLTQSVRHMKGFELAVADCDATIAKATGSTT